MLTGQLLTAIPVFFFLTEHRLGIIIIINSSLHHRAAGHWCE